MVVRVHGPARASLLTAAAKSKPSYHLLELTPDLVHLFENEGEGPSTKRAREEGEEGEGGGVRRSKAKSLCIKGRQNDEAVLCTDSQTYLVRQVTQSNSLLLCTLDATQQADQSGSVTVRDNVVTLFELVPIVARVGRIATLLQESAYTGEEEEREREEEEEGGKKQRRYTPQQLASVIQASPDELRAGLREAYVVEIDGHLRMMDAEYLLDALTVLLAHIDKLALSPDRVLFGPAATVLESKHNMRLEAAQALLTQWFGSRSSHDSNGSAAIALDETKVAQYIGLRLLEKEAAGKQTMALDEFMRLWTDRVGQTLAKHVQLGLLDGHCLLYPEPPAVATKLDPARIQHFSSTKLSLDVAVRFQTLFTKRAQWTAEALTPFLRDVAVDVKRRDALLLKFARTSNVQMPVAESKQERRARLMGGNPHPPTKSVQLYSARLRYGS